ncbi:unnamed protein product [Acanthoscelides obtectus]|uniref:Uncharacterized protein n=1 Tax=Acanthoscelides obtectus TaxID=200917 RepID=A0A9P0LSE3_ACAOB|nr:unnamed protein product [Acanthoscelides obtectus]CAK1657268.1 hypothetical protein AOBTE_LOCUS20259 [Acanthoscelides obtectus]
MPPAELFSTALFIFMNFYRLFCGECRTEPTGTRRHSGEACIQGTLDKFYLKPYGGTLSGKK